MIQWKHDIYNDGETGVAAVLNECTRADYDDDDDCEHVKLSWIRFSTYNSSRSHCHTQSSFDIVILAQ